MLARCCKRKCAKSKPPSLSPPSSSSSLFCVQCFYLPWHHLQNGLACRCSFLFRCSCLRTSAFILRFRAALYIFIYLQQKIVLCFSSFQSISLSSFFFSFFSRYGGGWHVLMGEGFGFEITNDHNSLLYMFFGGLTAVLVWKCN